MDKSFPLSLTSPDPQASDLLTTYVHESKSAAKQSTVDDCKKGIIDKIKIQNTESEEIHPRPIWYRKCITETMLKQTDYDKVVRCGGYDARSVSIDLIISKKRLASECLNSFTDHKLPLFASITHETTKYWPDWVKIVDIESKGIYIGIKYGYDQDLLCSITRGIDDELPIELTTVVIEYCMSLEIKAFIMQPSDEIMAISRTKYKKWVSSILVRDFGKEIEEIANKFKINLNAIQRCFEENNVDYSYLHSHSKRQFTELLGRYQIKTGPAIKIHRSLCDKHSIEITYGANTRRNNTGSNNNDLSPVCNIYNIISPTTHTQQ